MLPVRVSVDPASPVPAAPVKIEDLKPESTDYVRLQMTCMPHLSIMGFHEAHWQIRRRPGTVIDEIILHATESGRTSHYQRALEYLSGKNGRKVSCHYLIGDKHGQIAQLVKDERRAAHAGPKSEGGDDDWRGGHNNQSIGIELFKKDHDTSDYSDWQYEAASQLCLDLMIRLRLTRSQIIGHAAVSQASQGKEDPRNFDWDRLDRTIERINQRVETINPRFAARLREVDRPGFIFGPDRIRRRKRRKA